MKVEVLLVAGTLAALSGAFAAEADGQWKTAFYKRGFCGAYDARWGGGVDSTVRMPVPMYFSGSKVRVWLKSGRGYEIGTRKLSLAQGVNRSGEISGKAQPILFSGAAELTIPSLAKDVTSDETTMPITQGLWYLEQSYSTPQSLYAYDADGFFFDAGEAHDKPALAKYKKGTWPSNVYRIDVFTTDPRPVIACYGDSITQGAGSTPMTGNRYPELLAGLLKQPTINLGVNGDLAFWGGGSPVSIRPLDGVGAVVFLMGINDIISGKITEPAQYIEKIRRMIAEYKKLGIKIYLGTIMPAKGYAKFDADPAKEVVRQGINEWIRGDTGADGFIDFDAAIRDPADPAQMQEALQADRLHPNDAGYQKMAETAAAKLRS